MNKRHTYQDEKFLETLLSIINVKKEYSEIFEDIYGLFTKRFGSCFLALGLKEGNKIRYPYLGNSQGIREYNSQIDLEKDVKSQGRKCFLESREIYIRDSETMNARVSFSSFGDFGERSKEITRSVIYIPLKSDIETIGIFTIQSLKANFFSDDDINLLRRACKYLYIIIKNYQDVNSFFKEYQAKTKVLADLYNYDILTGFKNEKSFYEKKRDLLSSDTIKGSFLMIKLSDILKIKSKVGVLVTEKLIEGIARGLSELLEDDIEASYRVDYETLYFDIKRSVDIDKILLSIDEAAKGYDVRPLILDFPKKYLDHVDHLEDLWLDAESEDGYLRVASELIESYRKKWFVEANIHKALEDESFFINFQPKIDSEIEKILGVEALARWMDKDFGFISPLIFIEVAESKGLIPELDKLIFKKATTALKSWKEDPSIDLPKDFTVSVNTSIQTLESRGFIEYLKSVCNELEVSPKEIEIEITESIFSKDLNKVVRLTEELKENGFFISIDDFTTGFSSVVYLDKINPHIIKLDKSLVDNIGKNETEKILYFIINLVKSLKFKVVVEGVETLLQVNYLKDLDVDLIQGYYYSRPLLEEDLVEKYFKI